jgi:hypothetical protein
MKRVVVLSAMLLAAAALAVFAQDKPPVKPDVLRAKLVGVEEITLAPGEDLQTPAAQILFPIEGRPRSTFYLLVKVSRELPEKNGSDVKGLDIALASAGTSTAPSAVAAMKRDLDGDKPTHPAFDKKRWVSEVWYFPVAPGQRDWTVTINGQPAGRVLDYYATLIVRNVDDITSCLNLPDGSQPVVNPNQAQKFYLPAGPCDLVIEVRGKGKVAAPWKKYDKGDVKYLAVVGDPRNAPALPVDNIRRALPKISKAWQMYHAKKGVGGGGYNIAASGEPVYVNIEFGKGGVSGGMTSCWSDEVRVDFLPDDAPAKPGRKAKEGPRPIKYSYWQGNGWRVEPWEKVEIVDISEDAKKVVGLTTCGRFVVRSMETSPSLWTPEGLLQKGVVLEQGLGAFQSEAKKEGELIVVWGNETK